MVRAVEEGSKQPSKSLKGSKLRHTSNLTFSKTGLKLHTKKIAFVLENHRIRDKYVQKILFSFTINKIIFTKGERKKRNGLTSTECSVKTCQFLPLSSPYWKWSYHNATQSECAHRLVKYDVCLSLEPFRNLDGCFDPSSTALTKLSQTLSNDTCVSCILSASV